MGNRAISKTAVNKEAFIYMLERHNMSIRKLATLPGVDRSDRTIRQYLNNGEMPEGLLNSIYKVLNSYKDKPNKGVIVPIEMPSCCADCYFHSEVEEISVPGFIGHYEKISRCRFCPPEIEDGWRNLVWQLDNKEEWCPLKEEE